MSFCKASQILIENKSTTIENSFISEFLPSLDDRLLRVYLYGLFLCQNAIDNTIETFTKTFDLTEEDVISIFKSLEELNLVDVLELNPIEVRYLPIKHSSMRLKKYNKDKFRAFNETVQAIIFKRMIDVKEYEEYYYLIENKKIEPEALIKIIEFCAHKKGNDVSELYILKIARNWIFEGLLTAEQVENRIADQEKYNADLALILASLGSKRSATTDEYQLFLDWINNLDFEMDSLIHLAKITKKKKGNFSKLNAIVNKCYELKKFSVKEIDDYFLEEETFYSIAKQVCKNLGLRYDNLSIVVETYVSSWCNLGYDLHSLSLFSQYCFKGNVRTLEGMNSKIVQFYKRGLLTIEAINNYIEELTCFDGKIQEILEAFGITRNVNQFDRNFYNTWVNDWRINSELINYAISISKNKVQPMQFLNRVLSVYHTKNISTVEQAKKETIDFARSYEHENKKETKVINKTYSKDEIKSLFDTINEVEL